MAAGSHLPTVAIVGRANVGKSTLFNRIVGGRRALVDDVPGVTRDRLIAEAEWEGRRFEIVDTGGFEAEPGAGLAERVRAQALRAVSDADCVIFVLDGRAGIAPADREMARLLARSGKPVLCAVNKIDGPTQEALTYESYALGLGDPVAISAEHGRGIDELLDRLASKLPARDGSELESGLRVAIVGRPNVGKSSIVNRLVGEERVLVDSVAGTTRDSVDTRVERDGEITILVDTAGIRRRSRIDQSLERASVAGAFRSLERAEVALLVVDAAEGVTDQDARLARLAWERGRGLALVVNKWDMLRPEVRNPEKYLRGVRNRYRHFENVPAVFVSALQGTHVEDILPAARRVASAFRLRIPTRQLNQILEEATAACEAPLVKGKRARVYYGAAVGTAPPTIALFVNDPVHVTTPYLRYLENQIRAVLPLEGTPLRLVLRARPRQAGTGRNRKTQSTSAIQRPKRPSRKTSVRVGTRGKRS